MRLSIPIKTIILASIVHSISAIAFDEKAVVITPESKIYKVSKNGDSISQVSIRDTGEIEEETDVGSNSRPVNHKATDNGNIVRMIPYGKDGLIVYTSKNLILAKDDKDYSLPISLGTWDVKDMAVINDDLYILTSTGQLSRISVKHDDKDTLLADGKWKNITNMIAVGQHLVIVDDQGKMFRVDSPIAANVEHPIQIGRNWVAGTEFLALDDKAILVLAGEKVQRKEISETEGKSRLKEKYAFRNLGRFRQGMLIEGNKLLFRRNNAFIVNSDDVKIGNNPIAVNDVIRHVKFHVGFIPDSAEKFNLGEMESDRGRACILDTISKFVAGNYPKAIRERYPVYAALNHELALNQGHAVRLVAEYCSNNNNK